MFGDLHQICLNLEKCKYFSTSNTWLTLTPFASPWRIFYFVQVASVFFCYELFILFYVTSSLLILLIFSCRCWSKIFLMTSIIVSIAARISWKIWNLKILILLYIHFNNYHLLWESRWFLFLLLHHLNFRFFSWESFICLFIFSLFVCLHCKHLNSRSSQEKPLLCRFLLSLSSRIPSRWCGFIWNI